MTRFPLRWPLVLAVLLGPLALPVCAADPRALQPSDAGGSLSAASPPPISKHIGDQKPPPHPAPPNSANQVAGSKAAIRRPDETPQQFATRILRPGDNAITKPLELDLPPLGKVVLVLYEVASDDPAVVNDPSVYRGLVLVPDGGVGSYHIEQLPSQKEGSATLMYDVLSVFAADADGDGAPELCILSEITEAGAGDRGKPHTDTDLFKWSGSAFTLVRQSDKRPLYNLKDAKAVRARLRRMNRK